MKNAFRFLAALALLAATSLPAKADPKAVVELFTSQGCSSCPPADAFLGKLARRDDIIALSFPIDYWDYLGWKDTFGRHEHTERQYAYSRARGDRRVYTPQIVVNGDAHYVGSNEASVNRAISEQELSVPVTIKRVVDTLEITIGKQNWKPPRHTTVRLVTYLSKKTVAIGRGENTGREITYHNIVRSVQAIGMWKGRDMTITLPVGEVMDGDEYDGCAVIVQVDRPNGPGEIIGAAKWERPGV